MAGRSRVQTAWLALAILAQLLVSPAVSSASVLGSRDNHGARTTKIYRSNGGYGGGKRLVKRRSTRGTKTPAGVARGGLAGDAIGANVETNLAVDATPQELAAAAQPNPPPAPPLMGKAPRQTAITEERPLIDLTGDALGLEYGLTISEFHQVRDPQRKGIELVHVVNYDGSSNVETVLARWRPNKRRTQRIELQGPAFNAAPGGLMPYGFRIAGVGLTDDLIDPQAHEALSYTLEVKATDRSVAALAIAGVAVAQRLLPAASAWTSAAVQIMTSAIPVVSASLAVTSLARAWRLLRAPTATPLQRTMAIAHAAADVVRIFMPLVGTALSASLVAVFGVKALIKWRHLVARRKSMNAAAGGPGLMQH